MTGAAATAAASAATASGTPTKNASKGSELFRLQLLVLLVWSSIYYYHTTITAGTWLTSVSAADGEYANVPSSRVYCPAVADSNHLTSVIG